MKITVVEESKQYKDSVLRALTENAIKAGYRAVYTVTCLTCNTEFLTERMPPVCPNKECPEHKVQA